MGVIRYSVAAIALMVLLAGCGGPEHPFAPPTPPPDGNGVPVQVGPLLVRPASAAGFVAEEIPTHGPISLVALYGSQINYLASQAMLDRIVFSRGAGADWDLWVCNLDGSNAFRLLDNAHADSNPTWSPDGGRIAFDRQPLGQDTEIAVINADGSGAYALTNNSVSDSHPTWSPEGHRVAFETNRDGNVETYMMYTDGSGPTNLSNHAANDRRPDWSPRLDDSRIAFESDRDGNREIYTMREDGSLQTRITNRSGQDSYAAFDPDGSRLAHEATVHASVDIVVSAVSGGGFYVFSGALGADRCPAWSGDGRFICYSSDADGDYELVLQQTDPPYDRWQLTRSSTGDAYPDLGSPTLQTDRVIIGPAGSDWGGTNPIWSNAYGAIAAYTEDGYQNLVRIGIRAEDVHTLQVTPLAATAQITGPAGVVIEAAEVVNLREDGGRGQPSVLWQFDALDPTAVLAYFDVWTGKLLAAMVLRDQNYPAGAGGGLGVSQRAEGDAVVVEGAFAAVFDATGARVADAAAEVRVAAGGVSVLR